MINVFSNLCKRVSLTLCLGQTNLVFRATVLKTLGRVGSVFLRVKTSIIKVPTKTKRYFRKKSLGSAGSDR